MSGRRREGLAPNLFPFLAVLICTLGTLILLLALVAENAGNAFANAPASGPLPTDADDAAMRELIEADAEINRRLSEARWHRDKVVNLRDEQTAEIDERRIKQTHLENHLNRLRDELKQLEAEVNATQDDANPEAISREGIDRLKVKINAEKAKIETLKSEMQSTTPRIVIVPHKGPNGTDRRPIYIECRANEVYLQPGDIAIDPKYLQPDLQGPNPLDAALRAFRLHAMQDYGDTVAPYPLIVVRPAGIETYGVVRYSMRGWDDQFGYELVPDDVKLAFPEPDPVLTNHVEKAIAKAVMQQRAIAQNGYGGVGGRGGYDSRTSADGIEGDANGGASGGRGGAAKIEGGGVSRPASDLPVLSARNMDAGSISGIDNSELGSRSKRGISSQSSAQRAADAASANAAKSAAKFDAEAAQLAKSQSGTATSELDTQPQGPSYAGLVESQSDDSAEGAIAELNSPNGDKFAPQSDTTSNTKASATTDPNAPVGGTQAMGTTSSNNPAATVTQPNDNYKTPEQQIAAPPQSPPSPRVSVDVNGRKPPQSLVKRGGKNWALPPDVASMVGTSMVRMIRVECYDDRLVLLPEGGRGATSVYGFSDGDIDRASLELATAIRDRVDRWGAAMPGGKWAPLVEVNVAPGGERRFQQFERLMDGSGVDLQPQGAVK